MPTKVRRCDPCPGVARFRPRHGLRFRPRAAVSVLGSKRPAWADWLDIRVSGTPDLVVVGGDLNAFAGSGPQDHDDDPNTADSTGSTAELDLLKASLLDPYVYLAGPSHCSNKRIDFILVQGAYIPTAYEACFSEATPSDHPFVLVTFEAGDR